MHEGTLPFSPIAVAFSPDGHLLAAAGERTLWVYALEQDKVLFAVPDAHTRAITGLVWSPDGAWVATASADHAIRLWRARPTTTTVHS